MGSLDRTWAIALFKLRQAENLQGFVGTCGQVLADPGPAHAQLGVSRFL